MEPVTRKFRKSAAIASRRAPTEDEEILSLNAPARYLRLGNMLLRRNRPKAAALEYEKGSKLAGRGHWLFEVKLGRTYLALGQPDRALKAVSELLTLQPELPWPHLIAGQALLEKGQAQSSHLRPGDVPGHQPLRSRRPLQPGRGLREALAIPSSPPPAARAPSGTAASSASSNGTRGIRRSIRRRARSIRAAHALSIVFETPIEPSVDDATTKKNNSSKRGREQQHLDRVALSA